MEGKGIHVNMKKTTILVSGSDLYVLQKACRFACPVYHSGASYNSTECSQYKLSVHKWCSTITDQLVADTNYVNPRDKGNARLPEWHGVLR